MDAMAERTMLCRAYGERDLARALDAHLRAMRRLRAMKHAGHSGWEAWRGFFAEAGTPEWHEVTRRAHARKVELGLWAEGGGAGAGAEAKGGVGPKRRPGVPAEWLARQQQVQALVREREARQREAQAEAEAAEARESSGVTPMPEEKVGDEAEQRELVGEQE